ncbi:MAG: heavy metal translocating P-type ATPase [Coriobacteriia bacterium]|nr:heavy metal translocating P-type ATPase [Coriobacteriia bacterium]
MRFLDSLSKRQRRTFVRIVIALAIFAVVALLPLDSLLSQPYALWAEFVLFLIPYLIAGYDVLWKAARNIGHGQIFDENFLMSVATLGAFALVFFPDAEAHMAEGAAVMLFYQVGELFQDYAVGKSRKSIADMMDIAPEFATVMREGQQQEVDPYDVSVGETIVVKPGERVPLDGLILDGATQLDTAALTGESVPRTAKAGDRINSGCINLTGAITVQVEKPYSESTVQRILELVENASEKKARTESFITRFARYYTPIVVGIAAALAILPPLVLGQSWSDWIERGLIFLVVSCPCALVISVPLTFFGGIGAASKVGILVKGSNYLEVLSQVDTVVFDKTGTLTNGTFNVVAIHANEGVSPSDVLQFAAHAEAFSNHPIALSVREAYQGAIDESIVSQVQEQSGKGVRAMVEERLVLVGNHALMEQEQVPFQACELAGTVLHVALDGAYLGHIVIADVLKGDARQAVLQLQSAGVKRTVMLTGDRAEVAEAVAAEVGINQTFAELLPEHKVQQVESLLAAQLPGAKLAFVGDGINDAPVLTRADVGIAMGAMGSDAAIEAADVVLMDDRPSHIATAITLARKTMRIAWQNIIFALGVKIAILILAAVGIATMWLAVFGDVGVCVLAILNAMRALRVKQVHKG